MAAATPATASSDAWCLFAGYVGRVVIQAQLLVGRRRSRSRFRPSLRDFRRRSGSLTGEPVAHRGHLRLHRATEGAVHADGADRNQRDDDDVLRHALTGLLVVAADTLGIESAHVSLLRVVG